MANFTIITRGGRKAKLRALVRTLHRSGFTNAQIAGIAHTSEHEVERILANDVHKVRRTLSHQARAYWGAHQEDRDEDYHLDLDLSGGENHH